MARVVVGLDGSPAAIAALGFAVDEARLRGATLHVVHASEAPDWSGSSSGDSVVGRVVFAALSERSRHHAVSLARRHRPDVAVKEQRRPVRLIQIGGPNGPIAAPPPPRSAVPSRPR